MSEVHRLQGQLRAAFDGSPWHGPSVWELIADVPAAAAGARPVAGAHTIWELVLHMTHWRRVALEALAELSIADRRPDTPEDWPRVDPSGSDAAKSWDAARAALRASQSELLTALDKCGDERLEATVPGRDYAFYVLLHGVVQHDVYHAGQIALLKKGLP